MSNNDDKVLAELGRRIALAEAAAPGPAEVRCRTLDNHERLKIWTEFGWAVTCGELPRTYHDSTMEALADALTHRLAELRLHAQNYRCLLKLRHMLRASNDVFDGQCLAEVEAQLIAIEHTILSGDGEGET